MLVHTWLAASSRAAYLVIQLVKATTGRAAVFSVAVSLAVGTFCPQADAAIVNIDSQQNGAASAGHGPPFAPNNLPGAILVDIYGPRNQLTLGPGSYLITNAATSGYYSAWNFQGYPNSSNWFWAFMIADDATNKVLVDDYVNTTAATQAGMAAVTGTPTFDGLTPLASTSVAGFHDTLILSHTTTLDFLIGDYFLSDNGGGVSLNIQDVSETATPEPSTLVMTSILLAIFCVAWSYKRLWRTAVG